MHSQVAHFGQFLHPLQVHTKFFKMIQMDMVVIFKYYYSNIWIIHIQSLTNLPKSLWKIVFNVANVIFNFGNHKRKTPKVHKNNAPSKIFKKKCFCDKKIEKQTKIATHMDLWKYGQILTIQKSLVIKRLRFSKKRFFIWVIILYYIIYWIPITNLERESI
jgi:hypothetical protein